MAGIFVAKAPAGKPRCARCKRPFTPKIADQKYGPTCARKVAAQQHQDAVAEVHSAYGEQQRQYEKPDPKEV